jgi:S1-C subfamily serine protease
VVRGAPAALAGLRAGDVITSIDNRDVPTTAELAAIISAEQVGTRVVVGVVRAGTALVLRLSVADRPTTPKPTKVAQLAN